MYVSRYPAAKGYTRAVLHVDWRDGRSLRIETTRPVDESLDESSSAVVSMVADWLRGLRT